MYVFLFSRTGYALFCTVPKGHECIPCHIDRHKQHFQTCSASSSKYWGIHHVEPLQSQGHQRKQAVSIALKGLGRLCYELHGMNWELKLRNHRDFLGTCWKSCLPQVHLLASSLGITAVMQRRLLQWTDMWLQISLLRSTTLKHLPWSCTECRNVFVCMVVCFKSTSQA